MRDTEPGGGRTEKPGHLKDAQDVYRPENRQCHGRSDRRNRQTAAGQCELIFFLRRVRLAPGQECANATDEQYLVGKNEN